MHLLTVTPPKNFFRMELAEAAGLTFGLHGDDHRNGRIRFGVKPKSAKVPPFEVDLQGLKGRARELLDVEVEVAILMPEGKVVTVLEWGAGMHSSALGASGADPRGASDAGALVKGTVAPRPTLSRAGSQNIKPKPWERRKSSARVDQMLRDGLV